jgi:hypothetical protein
VFADQEIRCCEAAVRQRGLTREVVA